MTDEQLVFVDHTRWLDGWDEIEKLPGGGQGLAKKARRKNNGRNAFLKVIRKKGSAKQSAKQSARFFREASAYDTIRAPGIPRLIESNAHLWGQDGIEPYIATEFIEGPTLRKWREEQERVTLDAAIKTTKKLLSILEVCHANDVVHRDIKPDNIILANDDPGHPVLLDFGLSYHEIECMNFNTEHGEEVGNRFLRLPELSAGSPLKQDARSDLSFAAGILFYMLTGTNPDVLQYAEGRLPHQRQGNHARIKSSVDHGLTKLLALFDMAFVPQIADRFTCADAMLERLEDVMKPNEVGSSDEDMIEAIRKAMDTEAAQRQAATHTRIGEALDQVKRVHDETRMLLGFAINQSRSNRNISAASGSNTLGLVRPDSNETILSVHCEAREVGDEIVINLSGDTVFRTSITVPSYEESFDSDVRGWLLKRFSDVVTDPDALPPEADSFREYRPCGSLESAQAEAQQTGRNILAFVYDPTQEKRGKLQHCLGYFLENRRTRDTINAGFAVALVPLSQVAAVTNILEHESMERSRWIVFNSDLEPLEQQVIYANPQEGERIAQELANRFGH